MINMQHVGVLTPCSSCNLAHSSIVGTRFHTSGIKMTTVSILSPESNLSSAILCLEKRNAANKMSIVIRNQNMTKRVTSLRIGHSGKL